VPGQDSSSPVTAFCFEALSKQDKNKAVRTGLPRTPIPQTPALFVWNSADPSSYPPCPLADDVPPIPRCLSADTHLPSTPVLPDQISRSPTRLASTAGVTGAFQPRHSLLTVTPPDARCGALPKKCLRLVNDNTCGAQPAPMQAQ